jgi:hypothetical protein
MACSARGWHGPARARSGRTPTHPMGCPCHAATSLRCAAQGTIASNLAAISGNATRAWNSQCDHVRHELGARSHTPTRMTQRGLSSPTSGPDV